MIQDLQIEQQFGGGLEMLCIRETGNSLSTNSKEYASSGYPNVNPRA